MVQKPQVVRLATSQQTVGTLQQQEQESKQAQLVYSGNRQGNRSRRGAVRSAWHWVRQSPPVGGALWPLAREQVLGLEVGHVSIRLALARHLAQPELRLVCGWAGVAEQRVGGKNTEGVAGQTPTLLYDKRPLQQATERLHAATSPGNDISLGQQSLFVPFVSEAHLPS